MRDNVAVLNVDESAAQNLDIELSSHDIQALSNADAVAAFFARLGYNTDSRTEQTPTNLGITAEGTVRPIKKIELIADQENLFQVYLFELTSVTVTHTRALARAFRNRAGNYMLVLTSDYERLDFVLLEKYLPTGREIISTIGQVQVGIRPRTVTVERRKPSRLDLRVLRRLTWTESDPFAQYDKLLFGYSVADWSEENSDGKSSIRQRGESWPLCWSCEAHSATDHLPIRAPRVQRRSTSRGKTCGSFALNSSQADEEIRSNLRRRWHRAPL